MDSDCNRGATGAPEKRELDSRTAKGESGAILADHLERHVHDQLSVLRRETAEKLAEALEKFRRFTGIAPLVAIARDAFGHGLQFGRGFAVVEKLVERDFESAGHFFKRLDARDGVAVL